MSRILITGGTGFLGSTLVPILAEEGHRLRLIARTGAPEAERLGAELIRAPLQDPAALKRALKGIEIVYHLAGQVSRDPKDARQMYDLHVTCTRTLLEQALAAGVSRVVIASSSGVIGVSKTDRVVTEEDDYPIEVVARWPYYLSKIYQEKTALRFHQDTGLPVIALNPSLLLGPGDSRLSSTHDVFKFLERRIPAMPSGGVSFVDVRDVAQAFANARTKGRIGERHLLGGANMAFTEFFGRLSRMTGIAAPTLRLPSKANVVGAHLLERFHKWRQSEPPIDAHSVEMGEHFFYIDSSKAEHELGFTPRDAQETLYDTVRYIEQTFRRRKPDALPVFAAVPEPTAAAKPGAPKKAPKKKRSGAGAR